MTALAEGTHLSRNNIIIIEPTATYVYCAECGGLKFPHLFAAENPNQTVQITALWPGCLCQSTDEKIKTAIQNVLNDVYQASGHCKTVEAIREMLLSVASREEMKG